MNRLIKRGMKYLVCKCDTEGVPYRKKNGNQLWNIFMMFDRVVDTEKNTETEIFHTIHFAGNARSKTKDTRKSLNCHFASIDHLINKYDADGGIVAVFWNASHDKKCITHYLEEEELPFFNERFTFVDALHKTRLHFKDKDEKPKSFKLEAVADFAKVEKPDKLHTALADTLLLSSLMDKLDIKCHDV